MKRTLLTCLVAAVLLPGIPFAKEEWDTAISAIQAVGPEGEGNTEAAEAHRVLTSASSDVILPLLEAMDDAGPLARNWLRGAVEIVFSRERDQGGDLPAEALAAFVVDTGNDRRARELAFDLYGELEPEKAAALVPGMANDPSNVLRRRAVDLLLREGRSLAQDEATHDEAAGVLREALDAARDVDQVDAIAKLLEEKLGREVDLPEHFGFLLHWHVIAPFDNTGREGFDTVYPPEEEIDLDATYSGKGGDVSWETYASTDRYGKVDFNQPFSPLKEVVGYAYTTFRSAEERPAQLRLGCKNAWKIWLNGELVFGRDEYHRGQRIDQYILPVTLNKGENEILVKACQNEQEQDWTVQWEFQLRVCDETGTAILSTDRKPTPQKEEPQRRR